MDSLKHSLKMGNSRGKEGKATASKNVNKSVAKDGNVRMSTRLHAAKNAVSDKLEAGKHAREGDAHKHAAKHNY